MKYKILLIVNLLSLLVVLVVNYGIGSGQWSNLNVGEVSSRYPTLITPASWVFSIWGLIYLLWIGFAGFQWYDWWKGNSNQSLKPAGWWFFLANIANSLWIIAWVNEAFVWTLVLMLLLLVSLIKLAVNLMLEIWDAPLRIIVWVWWPICIYLGWIILASVLNVAVFLKWLDWSGGFLPEEVWAGVAIVMSAVIYAVLTYKRNMREAALVGSLGILAIGLNVGIENGLVYYTAFSTAAFLALIAILHGVKNSETSPIVKWKKGEY